MIIREEKSADCSENSNHSLFVVLQDSDDEEESRTLSILKSRRARLRRRKKDRAFSCKHCRRKFDSLVLLRAHRVIHVAGEKTFSCSQCGRRFGSKGNLDVHYQLHTDKSPYACSHCGKTFTEHKQLMYHQRIHNEDKTFMCKVCGKSFHQASFLRVLKLRSSSFSLSRSLKISEEMECNLLLDTSRTLRSLRPVKNPIGMVSIWLLFSHNSRK